MLYPKIAIIGAGPAGLTLARLLHQNNIPSVIYEAEPSRHVRNQGGTLDLHPRTGQLALKEAGLLEIFKQHSRTEGEATKIIKYDGSVLWDDNNIQLDEGEDRGRDRPEIDRVVLRDILLDSLPQGTVKWGMKLSRVEANPKSKGKHNLYFVNAQKEEGVDLLVGADGAWSKVRSLLTDEKPFYSGIAAVELWALDVDKKNPWLSQHVGNGGYFMFDEGRALICQRNGNGSIRAYVGLREPETWLDESGIATMKPDEVREKLIAEHYADCGEDLKRVIRESNDEMIPRKFWMLPVGIKWDSKPGVTLMGDAAHLMTPFAGVGVNVAMADALELAQAIVARKESITAKAFSDSHNILVAIKRYEPAMFERGRENAQKTVDNMKGHFGAKGGEQRAARLRKHFEMKAAAKAQKRKA